MDLSNGPFTSIESRRRNNFFYDVFRFSFPVIFSLSIGLNGSSHCLILIQIKCLILIILLNIPEDIHIRSRIGIGSISVNTP